MRYLSKYKEFVFENRDVPKARGVGYTMVKINRYLKNLSSLSTIKKLKIGEDYSSSRQLTEVVSKFNSVDELIDNMYFHGTNGYVSKGLNAGSAFGEKHPRGGGSGQIQHTISITKSKNIALIFATIQSRGIIYPVILKKDSNIIAMPEIEDAFELENMLPDLWLKEIDGVKIGNWNSKHSEQELVILNPKCILKMSGESFNAFGIKRFEQPTEEIIDLYNSIKNKNKTI
jgi:hypothetical protein